MPLGMWDRYRNKDFPPTTGCIHYHVGWDAADVRKFFSEMQLSRACVLSSELGLRCVRVRNRTIQSTIRPPWDTGACTLLTGSPYVLVASVGGVQESSDSAEDKRRTDGYGGALLQGEEGETCVLVAH